MPDVDKTSLTETLDELCGAVGADPADGRTSAQLLQASDAAMYAAKRSVGHQVERSSTIRLQPEVRAAVAG